MVWISVLVAGCGPDTIFVRPGLDTPAQHVANGYKFLQRGKAEDACREFTRAKELDPNYVKAYIGLGLALGSKGEQSAGLAAMDRAKQLARNPEELSEVQKGYNKLKEINTVRP